MITILINFNEKLIVQKTPNLSRTVFKTAKQNQIIAYAFVSSNLFTQLNTLTELNNFDSVSCITFQCRMKKFFYEFTVKKVTVFQRQIFLFIDIAA